MHIRCTGVTPLVHSRLPTRAIGRERMRVALSSPPNDWTPSMTLDELRKGWEPGAKGKVLRWADVRSGWPAETIELYGPGPASGTFDFFTEAVTGTSRASRSDYAASEDHQVIVKGVASNRYALGYVGYGYFNHAGGSLKAVAIDMAALTITVTASNATGISR